MAIKKSELYSSIWKSCDELRGGMDASQYKDYVLTLLFIKYVSDKYAGKRDALIQVPQGGSFTDMVALKGKKEIGEGMNKVISKLAEANDLKGVIDNTDFSDVEKLGKDQAMIDRLSNLIGIFENPALNFSKNRAEGDDLLGDAYEYLMRHFATESGKSKGQFYTPSEVSRIMAKVIGINQSSSQTQTIYDPTCGSGSLLLKAADEAPKGVTIYGQEMDVSTAALAKMNMILHDNPGAALDIYQDNTLAAPAHLDKDGNLKMFDFVVANPPFSTKSWSTGFNPEQDSYGRFSYGIPPAKNGDYAFLLHIIKSLKSTGKGAVILPHGVLFRGNAEATIRRELVKRGYIKGIIGLPANLFYGTGIPACIIVIDKENAPGRTGIFMIDASKGYIKDGNKNRLRSQDIHKVVDVFNKQIEISKYSRMVPVAEIASPANDYNLNIPRYIDSAETEDIHDIAAHLKGGIPARDVDALSDYWQVFPSLQFTLFGPADRPGYYQPKIDAPEVKPTIFHHPEFTAYADTVRDVFTAWKKAQEPLLNALKMGGNPKDTIHIISEDLLSCFASVQLLDKYNVYQQLMNYWADIMQDDVFAIASDGWKEANKLRATMEDKKNKSAEKPDFSIGRQKYKAELIPPALMIARYFVDQQQAITTLESKREEIESHLTQLVEEHGGEDGLLADALNDKGELKAAGAKARLKEIKKDPDVAEERALLEDALAQFEQLADVNKAIKSGEEKLYTALAKKYTSLTEAEIKVLVIEDKWMATLERDVMSEMERVTQALASRIRQLEERYTRPLPTLEQAVEDYRSKVETHLKRMGFAW